MIRTTASFLAILATSLIAAPVETSARGGGAFATGHAMAFHGGTRAPIIRPAPFARNMVLPRLPGTSFARFGHRHALGAPWYGWGYGAPSWYSGYDYDDDSTSVAPVQQSYSGDAGVGLSGGPTMTPNVPPPRLGCRTQTYNVPTQEGGETSVKVTRC
jgi:hypothetical protein